VFTRSSFKAHYLAINTPCVQAKHRINKLIATSYIATLISTGIKTSRAETVRDTMSVNNDRHVGDSCGYRALALLGAKTTHRVTLYILLCYLSGIVVRPCAKGLLHIPSLRPWIDEVSIIPDPALPRKQSLVAIGRLSCFFCVTINGELFTLLVLSVDIEKPLKDPKSLG
jgi:hypothetical protein